MEVGLKQDYFLKTGKMRPVRNLSEQLDIMIKKGIISF